MNLKYDGSLSNFAFNCNLRHYNKAIPKLSIALICWDGLNGLGGAVQVDPGFSQFNLHVLSTLETEM